MADPGVLYGHRVHAEPPLGRMRRGDAPRGGIAILRAAQPARVPDAASVPCMRVPADGPAAFELHRVGSTFVARWTGAGSATIDPAAGRVSVFPGGDPGATHDRILNVLVPILLAARGELVLHASAVRGPRGAVVVCGPSLRGKSTLAAALGAAGHPVLAEDAVALTPGAEGVLLWPGPAGVRLRPDAATLFGLRDPGVEPGERKHLWLDDDHDDASPVPVAAIVCLDPRDDAPPRVAPLEPWEAVTALFTSVLRLERATLQAAFTQTSELVHRVPTHRAKLQDDLPSARRQALELLEAVSPAAARAA